MKNNIIITFALCGLILLLLASALTVIKEDKEPPKITFGNQITIFAEGDDIEELLIDVEAYDKVEGDVSHTLTIESISYLYEQGKVSVTYAARDSKNNITKEGRFIPLLPKEADEDDEAREDRSSEDYEDGPDVDGGVIDDEEEPLSDEPGEDDQEEDEETEPLVSTGAPIIRLRTDTVTIRDGSSFNPLNYVAEAVDDKDDAWRRIYVSGNYSTTRRGTYRLRYSITDSDGNRSNVETLTLIVE